MRKQDVCTVGDLSVLLAEAERLGFVQRNTHQDLLQGKVMSPEYLQKCESAFILSTFKKEISFIQSHPFTSRTGPRHAETGLHS